MLQNSIRGGKVASSYLFYGLSGIGKRFTAVNFAKALNCASDEDDACDICPSCKKINSGIHPDFVIVEPQKGKVESLRAPRDEKSRKGSREIKVDHVRLLEEALHLSAYEAKYKVAVLDEAELMNEEAANAFLKTLEEPPSGTVIIIVSSSLERLPETIKSRCLKVAFKPLGRRDMEAMLKDKYPEPEKLSAIIALSAGRPGLALQEGKDMLARRGAFMKAFSAMAAGAPDGWTAKTDKQDIEDFIDSCGLLLRDMLIAKISTDEALLLNPDMGRVVRNLSKGAEKEVIIDCYKRLSSLKGGLVYNPNKSILWNYAGSFMRRLKIKPEAFADA